jgi:hypothetical protein
MELVYTKHAENVIFERKIERSWVDTTVEKPDYSRIGDDGNIHYFRSITEHEGRILHVVVTVSIPPKVITVFFDRREKQGV